MKSRSAGASQTWPEALAKNMDDDRLCKCMIALVQLIQRLRGPDGCPWDKKQTESSIKIYLLEEAYEVLAAIEKSSPQDVCSELGDLLFQILFLAQVATEKNQFDFIEVVEMITEKMIRRHPHVFGQKTVDSAEEVAMNWSQIKKAEGDSSVETSVLLESVPVDMPGLLRAHRLSERASKVGFDWPNASEIWRKVQEEFDELGSAIAEDEREEVAEELGDLLFSMVNLCRHWGLNAEHLVRVANQKFLERFGKMERELKAAGTELEEASPDQMNRTWEMVKDRERQ
ncbi:MAG: nucleoside triphosphate pyrophosphohydrolase [Pseudomonadota bacterium]